MLRAMMYITAGPGVRRRIKEATKKRGSLEGSSMGSPGRDKWTLGWNFTVGKRSRRRDVPSERLYEITINQKRARSTGGLAPSFPPDDEVAGLNTTLRKRGFVPDTFCAHPHLFTLLWLTRQ